MLLSRLIGLVSLTVLAGCGGSSAVQQDTYPSQYIAAQGVATYNEDTDTITIAEFAFQSGSTYSLRNDAFLPAGFNGYQTTDDLRPVSELAIRAVTPSGTGVAISFLERYSTLERTEPTPALSGSAVYTGDYAGIYSSNGGNTLASAAYVLGDVEMIADFDTSLINLKIENRRNFQDVPSHRHVVIQFPNAIQPDGSFVGSRTFVPVGELNGHTQVDARTAFTSIDGLFVGPNGDEVIGTFDSSYAHGPEQLKYFENGVFVLTK